MKALWIILAGFGSGIISGMGIGGGALLIPILAMVTGIDHKIAQSVNLFYFIPTAISALVIHIKNKNVEIKRIVPMLVAGVFGAALGAMLAIKAASPVLRKLFGGFLLILAMRELWMIKNSSKKGKNT